MTGLLNQGPPAPPVAPIVPDDEDIATPQQLVDEILGVRGRRCPATPSTLSKNPTGDHTGKFLNPKKP